MNQVFGYVWKTAGASGYEWFYSVKDRDYDLAHRLYESPEPKPSWALFDANEVNTEEVSTNLLAWLEASK